VNPTGENEQLRDLTDPKLNVLGLEALENESARELKEKGKAVDLIGITT
jgi:hypothetical protein